MEPVAAVNTKGNDEPRTEGKRLWLLGKFERLLRNRYSKDVFRALYMLVIWGSACALVFATAVFGDWKRLFVLLTTGCAVVGFYLWTIVSVDRPVFRVLFPMAYVLLVMVLLVFPWPAIRRLQELSHGRRMLAGGACGVALLMGVAGIAAGVAQGYFNSEQRALFQTFMERNRQLAGSQKVVVAWPDAFPLQYESPFVRYETVSRHNGVEERGRIFQFNSYYASHPARLKVLKARFGEDVYGGLTGPDVVHLCSSEDQVKQLETFFAEHYKQKVRGVPAEEFEVGNVRITAWLLLPEEKS